MLTSFHLFLTVSCRTDLIRKTKHAWLFCKLGFTVSVKVFKSIKEIAMMIYNISYGFIFIKKISVKSLKGISRIIPAVVFFFFVFFLHFWNWFHCASQAQPNLQRVKSKIMCSNANQVWQQTDTKLTGRASEHRHIEARTENLLRPNRQRLRWPRGTTLWSLSGNMWRSHCTTSNDLRKRWVLPKTGVSDVNKEAFQGGTLNITWVGKCADPRDDSMFSQTFNPMRFS